MKQSARIPRTPANPSDSFQQQLNMYAIAAGAAGVGVLTFTQAAEAKIVYTATHHVVGKNGNYGLDLNHDGIADFTFVNAYGCNQDYCYDNLNASAAAGNGVEGKPGFLGLPYAYALKRGAHIGPRQPFSGKLMGYVGMGSTGRWLNVTNGYLGLKFEIKGKIHYGWARLTTHVTNGVIKALLTGYAYETTPNKPIIAGKTNGSDEIVRESDAALKAPTPRPATLGLLAVGWTGHMGTPALSNWPRRESVDVQ